MRRLIGKAKSALPLLAIIAVAWACASSGGGISGTSVVAGPIAGFGSILVNGVDFDTTNAVVTIEGDPADVADLKLGMFVFVLGRVNRDGTTGIAERVASDHLFEGPVDAVNPGGGTFTAFSQLVITDADTVFDQTTLATLAPADLVEVFGVLDADGSIRATRLEKKDAVEEFELTGFVSDLDTVAETFKINLLTVDFSSAELEGAPDGLANGQLVEVETEEQPINDVAIAVGVEVRDPDVFFEEADGAEIRGFVTEIVSATEFVLNRTQRVLITDRTVFEGGTREDLVLNAHVDVEGEFDGQGRLVAEEVEFLPE